MDDISAFLAVARTGSFTAAAALLHQPKTTISRRVRMLEEQLGVRLFNRTTRSIALTEAGSLYREKVEAVPQILESAAEAVSDLTREPSGWLRITMSHALASNLVTPAIAHFGQRYPDIRFDLVLGHEVHNLLDEDIDIALRLGPLPDSGLMVRRLTRLPDHIYAAPSYLTQCGRPEFPEDLVRHRVLANRMSVRPRGFAWALDDGTGLRDVRVAPIIIADDPDALKGALAAGCGLMLATDTIVRDLVATKQVVQVMTQWRGRSPELNALYLKGRSQFTKIRLFLDFLADHLK